jgi:rhodanese-related sulfurtransferase
LADLPPLQALSPLAFKARPDAVIIDVRTQEAYLESHLPGSLRIGLEGSFASWAGILVPQDADLLLVGEPEALESARLRLARIGLDHVSGRLAGGLPAWIAAGLAVARAAALEPRALAERPNLTVLDVRNPGETAGGCVPGAHLIPLADLSRRWAEVPAGPLAVICAGGYRSLAACGVLERTGFQGELFNVTGGTSAWIREGLPLEQPVGATTLGG